MVTTTLSNGCVHGVLREGAYWKTGVDVDFSDDEESRPTKRARNALYQQPQAVSDVYCRWRTIRSLYAGAHIVGDGSLGDIVDSFGEFAIRRVWCGFSEKDSENHVNFLDHHPMEEKQKEDNLPKVMELFRGHFSLRIYFGDGYVDRGCPEIGEHYIEFWAVRII
ncbi:hypothetical protein LENED_007722 [Lentinula edodes]|uniref:Uncharacterized protein n=1 Tax=Lentinula edodes TaxID=5353 RepID=A0A1Q3EF72_LENED|nr:hypothetical protein LENED_007722 [Lentinula edodes]